ncbi:MAG: transposase [Deltaproteobacteria bacterium]|nr:MAG: transposase [Deltaproteobacteria bacterium]
MLRALRGITTNEIFPRYPELKKELWGGKLWEDRQFVRTVGERMTRDVIEKYIEHDRDLTQGPAQLELKLR